MRGGRTAFLAISLYNIGVAAGLQRYALDPDGERRKMIAQTLSGRVALDKDERPKFCDKGSSEVAAVRRVFPRVLQAALEEVRSQEREAKAELAKVEGKHFESKGLVLRLERLGDAEKQLKSWPLEDFLVLDTNSPNAFVTAMVPRMLFVHSGLFNAQAELPIEDIGALEADARVIVEFQNGATYGSPCGKKQLKFIASHRVNGLFVGTRETSKGVECVVKVPVRSKEDLHEICVSPDAIQTRWEYAVCETDEHLAMLLSHELAHVVHGHSTESTTLLAQTYVLQMVMLAMLDPTGILTLLIEACVSPMLKYGVCLPHSRDHELEADATGLRIVARALYDPRDAAQFFERLLEFRETTGSDEGSEWKSTHPKHEHRIKALLEQEATALKFYEAEKHAAEKKHAANEGQRRPLNVVIGALAASSWQESRWRSFTAASCALAVPVVFALCTVTT